MNLSSSRKNIIEYSNLPENHRNHFNELLDGYISIIEDGDITSEEARKIRRELMAYYVEMYRLIFFRTMETEESIPSDVLMFLYFGFIDEQLSGEENAQMLGYLLNDMTLDENMKVFTFYQWLRLIYTGKKDPSINEFSLDYATYLRQERKQGRIKPEEELILFKDPRKRVEFELNNMFKNAIRMMSSHVTTFCPFFNKSAVYKPVNKMLVKMDDVHKTLDLLRNLDFSLFYRETVFTDPENGVDKEFIQVEVVPDVILMPVVGERAAMWQEITGAKRTTPGRFILPIFEAEELTKTIIKLCGEFRWELCRRIQGARWNDLTEKSLTSEYCDYIDTFKKNRDLTPEARERIKNTLIKHRGSYKEVFVEDYIQYIVNESQGALKLNKVSRGILFNYCPYSKPLRMNLENNPQFSKLIEIYNNKAEHKKHLFDVYLERLKKSGHVVPLELSMYVTFLGK